MDAEEVTKEPKNSKKTDKKLTFSIVTLVVGIITLIAGVVILVLTLNRAPNTQDAETLVATGSWQREDEPNVIWNFTEVGKGSLTTNAHTNDYNFIWAIEGDELKIETEWLYALNDEFKYEIKDGKLILDKSIVFVPAAN